MKILVYADSLLRELAEYGKIRAESVYDMSPPHGAYIDTLAEGEDRIAQITDTSCYDYTLVSAGYNDISYAKAVFYEVHPSFIAHKIAKLVRHIAGKNTKKVKFVSIPPIDDIPYTKGLFDGNLEEADKIIRETNQKIKEELSKHGIDFIDIYSPLVDERTHQVKLKFLSGFGYINGGGQNLMADTIEKFIWQSALVDGAENV